MAQEFQDKDMKDVEHRIQEDPLHDVKGQIESGVGTMKSEPLFEGASGREKLPETRVGETLLTDNAEKLEQTSSGSGPMDTESDPISSKVVKSEVSESFAEEYKKDDEQGSTDKTEEATLSDHSDSGKYGSGGSGEEDTQEVQEQQPGTKFKKLTGAGIPRGKPHFRISANHGNRGLGGEDQSKNNQGAGGPGGGLRGSRGNGGGGLARTGSGVGGGLARTGSGVPQGNNDLKDFSAALHESDSSKSTDGNKSSEAPKNSEMSADQSLPTSSDAKEEAGTTGEPRAIGDMLVENLSSADSSGGKASETRSKTSEKVASTKDRIAEKTSVAKETVVEKAGEFKKGFVETIKDQLVPTKDPVVSSGGNMNAD